MDMPTDDRTSEYLATLSREAARLRIPMSHVPGDNEYMPVLSYRIDQAIVAARRRLEELQALRDSYSA
jgi:hypothetical protein